MSYYCIKQISFFKLELFRGCQLIILELIITRIPRNEKVGNYWYYKLLMELSIAEMQQRKQTG